MIRKLFCFLLLCHAFSNKAEAQSLDSALINWVEKQPVEKIYVQFDNRRYSPGQTIWYKAYLTNAQLPSELSKNFYIDWYNDHGKMVGHTVAPISEGSSNGSFVVPEKFVGESLLAVAYTQWMRNFDTAFFFKKQLQISNENTKPVKKVITETTVKFLPESGNAIIGVNCNMAFKAVNQLGLPENIKCILKNNKGVVITSFNTIHNGMGTFQYKPQEGENYLVEWTDQFENIHQSALPEAEKMGVSLMIEKGVFERYFEVSRSSEVPEAWKKLTIVAQTNGSVVFKAVANLSTKTSLRSKLPLVKFPSGILQLTIFDANNQPLCERLLFVNNYEYLLDATVKADTLNLEKRGRNVFEIAIEDTTITNLSLAITDGNINGVSDNSILSQLLLTSDLKGNVYQPAYYFSSDEDSITYQLDLVMLTNGWRRYNWNQVLQQQMPKLVFERDTAYLSLFGKIKDISAAKIKKAEFVNMILVAKDSSKTLLFLPIEVDGSFSRTNLFLFDTTKIFYKLNAASLYSNSKLSVWNNLVQPDTNRIIATTNFGIDTVGNGILKLIASEAKRLELLKKQTTLKEVVVNAVIKSPIKQMDEKYTSGLFAGDDAYQFDLVNEFIAGNNTVLSYLQGKVAGLNIKNPYSSDATVNWRGGKTDFFLNEFQADAEQLLGIPMSDVAYIKVFRPPFFGSFLGGAGGAIAVYTKKGIDGTRSTKGLDYLLWPGYSPRKEFYSPNYAEQHADFNTGDFRNTLLWYPMISTDKNNQKIKFFFYNNDFSKSFHIILEGMDEEGKMVHFSKLLQ
jgi:hypothetical protein